MSPPLTRRHLLTTTGAGLGLGFLGLPLRRALAGITGPSRRLLVIFCEGGWDPTYFFATGTDEDVIDGDPEGSDALAGDIPFVDNDDRPAVRDFMDTWSDSLCVINGLEVHSVAHSVCKRELITGSLHSTTPDWPALVALERGSAHTIPLLHFSGPSFPRMASNMVVRVGANEQLLRVLTGEAMSEATLPSTPRSDEISAIEDAFVRQRIESMLGEAGHGAEEELLESALSATERMEALVTSPEARRLGSALTLSEQGQLMVEAFSAGLAHAGILSFQGDFGWDTHGANHLQSDNFEDLFSGLGETVLALSQTDGPAGGTLLEETMVVVVSEMGRYPKLNAREGKDHWTFTSAMLIGAGVAGGRVLGAYDHQFEGSPFDLETGAMGDSGVVPTPANLSATVLENCGIDASSWFPDATPIRAALAD